MTCRNGDARRKTIAERSNAPRRHRWSGVPRRAIIFATATATVLTAMYTTICIVAASVLTQGTHEALSVSASEIAPLHDEVSFDSRTDHVRLSGWLFHAATRTGRSVIFVHGWQANRVDTGYGIPSIAHDMVGHGYDVLLFDLRATGTSGGDRFTLGALEPRDLLGAYDFMRAYGYRPQLMTVIGDSMGAATEIEAAPQLSDVAALVSDSAFAELHPLIERELPKRSHLPSIFDWGVVTSAHVLYGVDPDLRPVDTVRNLPNRAFLFIHAIGDDFIPVGDARELRAASSNPRTQLLVLPGTAHVQTYKADPSQYLRVVFTFIDQQVAEYSRA